ncbi:ankyrin repeat-containing domain protein [Hyaloscypha finlandica]|nr:ankyrin repeat-containing domain protein [Hyaloscypha finlandica]
MPEVNEFRNIAINAKHVHLGNSYTSGEHKEPDIHAFLADLFLTNSSDDLAKTLRVKGKRVAGTCEWLLKRSEFEDWTTGNDLELLWLIGPPGIGKTIISSFLVEELQRKAKEDASMILAHYFCDAGHEKRKTAIAILRGILVQFFQQQPDFFELIREVYKIEKSSMVEDVYSLWRVLVQVLKNCGNSKIYILIDALDECEEPSRKDFLGLLEELDPSSKARILITGRPEPDINEAAQSRGQSLRLDSGKINEDLSKFINIRVDELQTKKKKNYPTKLIEDIRTTLQEKHEGTFLWASLVLEDIAATKTTREAIAKLSNLPSGLFKVYERLLGNIEANNGHAVFILQWVVVSRRPMTIYELATAQALTIEGWNHDTVPPDDFLVNFMDGFKACGPLLSHDPDTDTINLVHQSVKDYLIKTDCPSHYRVNQEETSLSILNTCWKYLSMQEFDRGALIIARSDANELEPRQLYSRILEAYGFLGYATEELRDVELVDRQDLITIFIRQCENLGHLLGLRDFWLLEFVRCDHVEGVQALIEKGADVMPRAKGGDTALHLATRSGFGEMCRFLIESGVEVDAKTGQDSQTALHLAVNGNLIEVVSVLLEQGANINEKNGRGNTAFFQALLSEDEDIALFLLEKGADFKIKGSSTCMWDGNGGWNGGGGYIGADEESALFPVAQKGCYAIGKLMVEKMDVNEQNYSHHTPLSTAVVYGRVAVAQLLIEAGADLGWKDPCDHKSLLYLAAEAGHGGMLQLLMEKGLDINAMAEYCVSNTGRPGLWRSRTALHFAAMEGSRGIVEMLIKGGAEINVREHEVKMPLRLVAEYGRESAGTFFTFASAARAGETDHLGWTALHHAADQGHKETVLLLIEEGADINAKTNDGRTALHVVARSAVVSTKWTIRNLEKRREDAEMALLLLEHGADIKATTPMGLTALHLAAREGNQTITELLLRYRADIDATDHRGRTALHWVASIAFGRSFFIRSRDTHGGVAQILLKRGANVGARDSAGQTALFAAAAGQHRRMSCILLQAGADSRTMSDLEATNQVYPKVDQLLRATEHWLNKSDRWSALTKSDSSDDEDDDDNEHQPNESGADELLYFLFEMAAYNLAEAQPSGTKLVEAANKGYATVVSLLLGKEENGPISKEDKESALRGAAAAGHEEIVRALIEGGVDLEPKESDVDEKTKITSALHKAASKGHESMVRLLLENGAKVGRICDHSTPLIEAACHGHEKVVEILLDGGADISYENSFGTALSWAASCGFVGVVRVLLERGASIDDTPGVRGQTALMRAVYEGRELVVRLLLTVGADVTIKDNNGYTAMYLALECNSDASIVLLLLQYGGDPKTEVLGDKEESLLSWAIARGQEATLSLLGLDQQCFDLEGRDGQILFTWAVEEEHDDVASRLLDMGVRKDVQPSEMLLDVRTHKILMDVRERNRLPQYETALAALDLN